jgi:pyruvate,water dikinase
MGAADAPGWRRVHPAPPGRGRGGTQKTRNVPVPEADRRRFALSDDDVLELARWGVAVEEHYSRRAGRPMPMDIEWAKDGRTGRLFILQARSWSPR